MWIGKEREKMIEEKRTNGARTRRSTNRPAEDVTLCLLDSGEGQEERHGRSPQRHEEQD